jgi:hypothetical protein
VIGTVSQNPWVRLCAMPVPTTFLYLGFLSCGSAILTSMGLRLPFNMSSTAKGAVWRPILLAFIEDSGAVEGGGRIEYRRATMKRWETSPHFRSMVMTLSWLWGICFILDGLLSTVLITKLEEDIGFAIGWSLPWILAMLQVSMAMPFIKKRLEKERAERIGEKIVTESV